MKVAILAVTEHGKILARRIAAALTEKKGCTCTSYVFQKYAAEDMEAFTSLRDLTASLFHETDALVYLSACGIAVRMIAPHIRSKTSDPAVIAVDEQGKFAVSLLSGHMGKANALTKAIADILQAMPVITTATDIQGKFSPDSFAMANGLHLCELDIAKAIAAEMVAHRPIGLVSDFPYTGTLPDHVEQRTDLTLGICISADRTKSPFPQTLHLLPKNIVIGAGCRKGISPELFSDTILNILTGHGIPLERVCAMHTIDRKKDEAAMVNFCHVHHIPLKCFSAEELMQAEGDFTHSDFVQKTVGVDNVCERSAVMDGGRLIVRKNAGQGITIALAEQEINIDFEREML